MGLDEFWRLFKQILRWPASSSAGLELLVIVGGFVGVVGVLASVCHEALSCSVFLLSLQGQFRGCGRFQESLVGMLGVGAHKEYESPRPCGDEGDRVVGVSIPWAGCC